MKWIALSLVAAVALVCVVAAAVPSSPDEDARAKYASTGGWGYLQFDDGKPLNDAAALQKCFECHALIKDRDYVFTRYAP